MSGSIQLDFVCRWNCTTCSPICLYALKSAELGRFVNGHFMQKAETICVGRICFGYSVGTTYSFYHEYENHVHIKPVRGFRILSLFHRAFFFFLVVFRENDQIILFCESLGGNWRPSWKCVERKDSGYLLIICRKYPQSYIFGAASPVKTTKSLCAKNLWRQDHPKSIQ